MNDLTTDYEAYLKEHASGGEGFPPSVKALGVLALALAGVAGAAWGLSFVEQMRNVPVTIAAGAGFGVLVGAAVCAVYRTARRTSGFLLGVIWAALCATALYADWVGIFHAQGKMVLNPLEQMTTLFPPGRARMDLFVQAVALCGVAALVAKLLNRGAFFCERCGTWSRFVCRLPPLYLCVPQVAAYAALARGDVSSILTASPVPSKPGEIAHHVVVRYCGCRHGRMWINQKGAVQGLQGIPLDPPSVADLLDFAKHAPKL